MTPKSKKALPCPPSPAHCQLTALRGEISQIWLVSPVTTSLYCSSGMKGVHGRGNLEESALRGIGGPPPKRTKWSPVGRALDLSPAI